MTIPSGSSAGPSCLSSSPKRKTFYPVWPETHDDAEYFEVPPDHFLAQQRGTNKPRQPSTSEDVTTARRASTASASTITSDAFMPVPGFSLAPDADLLSSSPLQPLSELATAVQSGVSAVPSSLGHVNPFDRLNDAVPRPAGFSTVDEHIPDTSTLAAADFDVDVRSGFLPPEAPIRRLSGPYQDHWEHALDEAKRIPLMQGGGGVTVTQQQRLLARRWRRSLREMPVLPLSDELANDIRYARRGHVVLSFLAHFYIHSQPRKSDHAAALAPQRTWLNNMFSRKSAEGVQDDQDLADELAGKFLRRVPAAIAVPWVQLSQKLDLPPVLTYATTVLWNWDYIDPARGFEASNVRIAETFTATPSEHHFFFTSLLIEAKGVEALELMRVSLDEAFVADRIARRRIAGYLSRLAVVIKDITKILHDVRTDCDPKTFYWGIRPWFVGSDTVDKGEQEGWQFEGVDAEGVKRVFSGPSAGQSTMIHAIDVFLDVDHTRRKERLNRPAAAISADARGADATFMERMSLYMPGHHRAFLSHLRNISFDDRDDEDIEDTDSMTSDDAVADSDDAEGEAQPRELPHPIRSLALKAKTEEHDEGLPAAYDYALRELKALRDEHMKIAYLYIVAQARGSPPDAYAPLPKGFTGEPAVDRKLAASAKAKAQLEAEADAALDVNAKDNGGGAKGTGGTDLVTFLRDCRVNTIDALIMAKDAATASSASSPQNSNTSSAGKEIQGASSGQSITPSHIYSASSTGDSSGSNHMLQTTSTNQPITLPLPSPWTSQAHEQHVHIWAVNISQASQTISETNLANLTIGLLPGSSNAAAREKVTKYYRHIDRVRSLVGRLLPRVLVSKHYGVAWNLIRFSSTREGRPYLSMPNSVGEGGARLDFNISHDGDWVVMAYTLSRGMRVGVDVMAIELPKYEPSLESFVQTMDMALTPKETSWVLEGQGEGEGEREGLKRLYTLWTYKEAYTKNVGKGLGFDFSRIHFDLPDRTDEARGKQRLMMIDGNENKEYGFVDVLLPVQQGAPIQSQLVVCHGPHHEGFEDGEMFKEQISAEQATRKGVLTTFSLKQIVGTAQSLVSASS
ncbi:related to BNA2 - tryptophan 2,3-dioxygenase [Melanopsichium pennsylvanicum]|uniref:Related to BNA2 - tryptophan 2,3-dioxygenase n=1 Tax=Melanopsichium pennsylvanicum TaxID=63383 RepID=A0AAJ4XNN1_9BASI|nr:related to BNA2 - tryptophan 2,3-dioxygenase [Melanopsichium pennsylvanicum]